MGGKWLLSLPDVLRNAGLVVETWPGWENRARSSGGYDGVFAVQVHHTASNTSPDSDRRYMWEGSPDRPVGAVYLARDGRCTVGAAGATNTSGKGGPRQTVHGTIPLDAANKYVISVEAANDGVGEPWPQAQQDAYVKLVAAINAAYGLHVGDVHSHWEWCEPNYPGRKIDPAGNSRFASGGNSWNMDVFRGEVWLGVPTEPPPTEPPPVEPPPTQPAPYAPPGNWGLFPLDAFKPVVKKGSNNEHVRYVQDVIHFYAGGDITRDGQFGDETVRRVKDLQTVFGFPSAYVDGIVGWDGGNGNDPGQYSTWSLVDFLVATSSAPPPVEPPPTQPPPATYSPPNNWGLFPLDAFKPTRKKGSSGEHVLYIQDVIYFLAGGDIARDGQFGDQTVRRVKDLQTVFGFPAAYIDGIVGWDGGNGADPGPYSTWSCVDFLVSLSS